MSASTKTKIYYVALGAALTAARQAKAAGLSPDEIEELAGDAAQEAACDCGLIQWRPDEGTDGRKDRAVTIVCPAVDRAARMARKQVCSGA
jgi:hypothetical protein